MNSNGSGDAGSGLDSDMLSNALASLIGDSAEGGLDIGSLLDSIGGISGAIGLASKLFGK